MASALRAWGKFCDMLGEDHFPVAPTRAAQFAGVCRDEGTYSQYISHIKAACDHVKSPTQWFEDAKVKRMRDGIKKSALVFKGPKLAASVEFLKKIAVKVDGCLPERFFCILSWAFMLRAQSEASGLVRAPDEKFVDRSAQVAYDGAIGLVGNSVFIRLKSRKNRTGGDAIERSCVCINAEGTSAHVPNAICPVHVLWPWAVNRASPGARIFEENIAYSASIWLRVAAETHRLEHFEKYTLHSLRRGAAQTLVAKGGDLATLLRAGSWKSSAFRAYLDLVGVENAVVAASIQSLFDFDEED